MADRREFVRTYRSLAAYEAARCDVILNQIDQLAAELQVRVLRGDSIDSDRQRLDDLVAQFNQAGEEFKQAGRSK